MKTILAFAFCLLLTVATNAQSYVYQSGNATPGHAVKWITNGVVGDGGTAANGFLTSLGVMAQGPGICQNSGPISGSYNQICIGNQTGTNNGFISFFNYGQTHGVLNFDINGSIYQFPGSGTGNVLGPNSSTIGDLAVWNNTSGTLLADVPPNEINVASYGAVGNGSTDDTAAINSAITACAALQGRLIFDGSKTYVIKRASSMSQNGGLVLTPGCFDLDFQGATLLLQDNASFIYGASTPVGTATVTANNAAGDTTITVGGGLNGCAVGQSVIYRLADDAIDSAETSYFGFATVATTTSTSITIDNPLPAATNIAAVTNPNNKIVICFTSVLSNVTIENVNLVTGGSGNPEEGVALLYAQNIHIKNIYSKDPGAGAITAQLSNGIYGNNIHVRSSQSFGSASKGRAIAGAEVLAFNVDNLYAENFVGPLVGAEFSAQITLTNAIAYNSNNSNSYDLLVSNELSKLIVSGLNVVGVGGYNLIGYGGGSGAVAQVRNSYIQASSDLYSVGTAGVDVVGKMYYNVAGTLEYYDFDHPVESTITIPLTNSTNNYFITQPGILGQAVLYLSSQITMGDLSDLTVYLGRRSANLATGDNGNLLSLASGNIGAQTDLGPQNTGGAGGAMWTYRALPVAVLVTSSSDFGSFNKFLTLQTFTYPNLATTTLSMTDAFMLAQSSFNPGISYTFGAPQMFADSGVWGSNGINGSIIGGSTAEAGHFTTLAASGAVSGSGFSTYLASPPAIGGTAPAAGAFTVITLSPVAIASLPSCGSGNKGQLAFVSDTTASGAATFHGTVSGSGSTTVNSVASCNGSNWQYD